MRLVTLALAGSLVWLVVSDGPPVFVAFAGVLFGLVLGLWGAAYSIVKKLKDDPDFLKKALS